MTKKKEDAKAARKNLEKQFKKQQETGGLIDFTKLPGYKESMDFEELEKKYKGAIRKKAMGGDLKTEYRAGGAMNLGNYKGQF